MEIKDIKVFHRSSGKEAEPDDLMDAVGLPKGMGFDGVAITSWGTIIVCDKCGHHNELDPDFFSYEIIWEKD